MKKREILRDKEKNILPSLLSDKFHRNLEKGSISMEPHPIYYKDASAKAIDVIIGYYPDKNGNI
jgi:hypothetical protein